MYGLSVPDPTDDPMTFWEAFRDGVVLLDVVDKIRPGMINWMVIARPKAGRPLQLFQRISNCTFAAQSLEFVLPSFRHIDGKDIAELNNTNTLVAIFQELVRTVKPK